MSKTFETKEQFRAELKIAAKNSFEKALKEIGPEISAVSLFTRMKRL